MGAIISHICDPGPLRVQRATPVSSLHARNHVEQKKLITTSSVSAFFPDVWFSLVPKHFCVTFQDIRHKPPPPPNPPLSAQTGKKGGDRVKTHQANQFPSGFLCWAEKKTRGVRWPKTDHCPENANKLISFHFTLHGCLNLLTVDALWEQDTTIYDKFSRALHCARLIFSPSMTVRNQWQD